MGSGFELRTEESGETFFFDAYGDDFFVVGGDGTWGAFFGFADEAAFDVADFGDRFVASVAEMGGQGGGVDEQIGGAGLLFLEGDDDVRTGDIFGMKPKVMGPSHTGDEFVVVASATSDPNVTTVCRAKGMVGFSFVLATRFGWSNRRRHRNRQACEVHPARKFLQGIPICRCIGKSVL